MASHQVEVRRSFELRLVQNRRRRRRMFWRHAGEDCHAGIGAVRSVWAGLLLSGLGTHDPAPQQQGLGTTTRGSRHNNNTILRRSAASTASAARRQCSAMPKLPSPVPVRPRGLGATCVRIYALAGILGLVTAAEAQPGTHRSGGMPAAVG